MKRNESNKYLEKLLELHEHVESCPHCMEEQLEVAYALATRCPNVVRQLSDSQTKMLLTYAQLGMTTALAVERRRQVEKQAKEDSDV